MTGAEDDDVEKCPQMFHSGSLSRFVCLGAEGVFWRRGSDLKLPDRKEPFT